MTEESATGTARLFLRLQRMQYLIYFAVTTPLLLGWLFWQAATMPPEPPLFASGYEHIAAPAQQLASAPVTAPAANKKLAKNEGSSAN